MKHFVRTELKIIIAVIMVCVLNENNKSVIAMLIVRLRFLIFFVIVLMRMSDMDNVLLRVCRYVRYLFQKDTIIIINFKCVTGNKNV